MKQSLSVMVLMWPSRHVGLLSFIIKTCLHNWLVIGNWVIHPNLFLITYFVTVREGFVSKKVLYLSLWGLRNNLDQNIGHYWINKSACIFKQTARLYWICGFWEASSFSTDYYIFELLLFISLLMKHRTHMCIISLNNWR